jgi:hypothetical protein
MQKLTDRKKTLKRNKPYKKALRQQEAELDSRIRQTFEQASQALRETLAQTALLRTMIAGSATPTRYTIGTITEPALSLPLPQSLLPPEVNEINSKECYGPRSKNRQRLPD